MQATTTSFYRSHNTWALCCWKQSDPGPCLFSRHWGFLASLCRQRPLSATRLLRLQQNHSIFVADTNWRANRFCPTNRKLENPSFSLLVSAPVHLYKLTRSATVLGLEDLSSLRWSSLLLAAKIISAVRSWEAVVCCYFSRSCPPAHFRQVVIVTVVLAIGNHTHSTTRFYR